MQAHGPINEVQPALPVALQPARWPFPHHFLPKLVKPMLEPARVKSHGSPPPLARMIAPQRRWHRGLVASLDVPRLSRAY
eukprot:1554141-Prymnesium_polylepis.1